MTGLWALLLLEIRTVFRDRAMLFMFALTTLMAGLMLPASDYLPEPSSLFESISDTTTPTPPSPVAAITGPLHACSDLVLPDVWVSAAFPPDLFWPVGQVPEPEAEVKIHVESGEKLPVLRLTSSAGTDAVETCLRRQIATAKRARLDRLNLQDAPDKYLAITTIEMDDTAQQYEWPALSVFGSLLGSLALMVAGSLAIEVVPRRRASGLLEQLRCTQTSEYALVWAWVGALTAIVWALCLACTLAFVPVAIYRGQLVDLSPGLHAPALAALVSAASIRTSLHATDVQSATLRWFLVVFALLAATALSAAWISTPALAALVPLGGSILASCGLLGPAGFLADIAAIAWTTLLVAWSARSLRLDDSTPGTDAALLRQARGNYLPEAAFLTAMGLCAAVVGGGSAFGGNIWVGLTFAFVSFMLVPSLLAGPVLGVDTRELLPFGRFQSRDLGLAVPMTFGMWALSLLVMSATSEFIPDNAMLRQFSESMSQIGDSPWAAIGIGLYPAICEEVLYRGVILGLLLRGGNTRRAIVLQAAAFSLAHVLSLRLPSTFVFGLVMGWIRVRTGSLWATMALHFCFNVFVAGVLPLLFSQETTGVDWTQVLYSLPLLLGLAALPLYRRRVEDDPPGQSTE